MEDFPRNDLDLKECSHNNKHDKKVNNFVVLGDIEFSVVAKKFLSIYYKCKTRKYRTENDIKIEVNKIGVKNRYEKMGQGDDLEDLTDEEIVK